MVRGARGRHSLSCAASSSDAHRGETKRCLPGCRVCCPTTEWTRSWALWRPSQPLVNPIFSASLRTAMWVSAGRRGDSRQGGGEEEDWTHAARGPRCRSCRLSWEISDMPHHTLLRGHCRTRMRLYGAWREVPNAAKLTCVRQIGKTTASTRATRAAFSEVSVVLSPKL